MPVATQASLKGLTPQQLEETGCRLCLNNTYHLGLKPGQEVLEKIGGAHKLQGWKHNILTDSGGYVLPPRLWKQAITWCAQLSDGESIETGEYHRGRRAIP
jgi:hypothetical protein